MKTLASGASMRKKKGSSTLSWNKREEDKKAWETILIPFSKCCFWFGDGRCAWREYWIKTTDPELKKCIQKQCINFTPIVITRRTTWEKRIKNTKLKIQGKEVS